MNAELGRRIAFTLGALLIYRIGTYIPLPGIDPAVWFRLFRGAPAFSSHGLHGLAIFALDILPYVSAAVVVQLFMLMSSKGKSLNARGQRGRRTIERYTLGLTAVFVILQSLGIASGLEGSPDLVIAPGWLFHLSTVVTLAGGTFFLIWLSEQITLRGVGNGLALILFVGIVMEVPPSIADALDFGRRGVLASNLMLAVAVLMVAVIGLIVVMEMARRCVPIEYSGRQVGTGRIEALTSDLSLKLNNAGIIPIVAASWLLSLLLAAIAGGQGSWFGAIAEQLGYGQPGYMIYIAVAIIIFALVYTAFVLDPEEIADKLKKYGGSIPGVEPGEATAEHVDFVVSRTAILGAVYLAFVCLVPELLIAYAQVPFYFGGVSALIVVCAVLDIDRQIRGERRVNLGG
jgi:preprotein translocase subunit SecY